MSANNELYIIQLPLHHVSCPLKISGMKVFPAHLTTISCLCSPNLFTLQIFCSVKLALRQKLDVNFQYRLFNQHQIKLGFVHLTYSQVYFCLVHIVESPDVVGPGPVFLIDGRFAG